MAGGVVLHKAIFVYKTRERRSSSIQSILKGNKRATFSEILIIIFLSTKSSSFELGSPPRTHEEASLTDISCQVLRLGSSSLRSPVHSQVFHNHGHGFPKDYYPAG